MLNLVNLIDYDHPWLDKNKVYHPKTGIYAICKVYDSATGELKEVPVRVKTFYESDKDFATLAGNAVNQTIGKKEDFIKNYPNNIYNNKQNNQKK